MRKKIAGVIVVSALLAMSTTAFAHGHGGRHHSGYNRTYYNVCSIEGCDLTYNHSHNGTIYGGHHNGDGHGHCY